MSDNNFDTNDLFEHVADLDKTAGEHDKLSQEMGAAFDRTGVPSRYASFYNGENSENEKQASGTQFYWWPGEGNENGPEIQKSLAWVKSQAAWGFAVQWEGYAGGDATFQLAPLAKEPTTTEEIAVALNEKAHYVAAAAHDGYFSWIEKNALAQLLEMMVQNPDTDPSEFQAADAFMNPVELPDNDELVDQHWNQTNEE